jgi:hypothetical protein
MFKVKGMMVVILACFALAAMSAPAQAQEWAKTYGGASDDYASSIQQTSEGGYIVAGSTASFGAGSRDAWVLKLDASGNVTWQKTYGGAGWDYAESIQQDQRWRLHRGRVYCLLRGGRQ